MTRARPTRSRRTLELTVPAAVLSIERAGRRNRRSARDRLRWERELWNAYVHSEDDPDSDPDPDDHRPDAA